MATGKINVQTENIFPIIKKFLYSETEIFLRELVSNAVDASQKLKTLSSLGEFKGEIPEEWVDSVNREAEQYGLNPDELDIRPSNVMVNQKKHLKLVDI